MTQYVADRMVVTPAQFAQGWNELRAGDVVPRRFVRLRTQDDGNIVVKNPQLTLLQEARDIADSDPSS